MTPRLLLAVGALVGSGGAALATWDDAESGATIEVRDTCDAGSADVVLVGSPSPREAATVSESSHAVLMGLAAPIVAMAPPEELPPIQASSTAPSSPPIALRVRVVDAETGVPVPMTDPASGERTAAITRDSEVVSPFEVTAPIGFVAWDKAEADTRMSIYATSLAAVYPLRREVLVRANVSEFDGRVPKDPVVSGLHVAGRYVVNPVVVDEGGGRLRLRGVPFLRDEPISFTVDVKDFDVAPERLAPPEAEETSGGDEEENVAVHWFVDPLRSVSWSGRLPEVPWRELDVPLVLPRPDPEAASFLGPSRKGLIGCCGDNCGCGSRPPPKTTGTLVVEARRRNGAAAARAWVTIRIGTDHTTGGQGRLDGEGRASFHGLAPGHYVVRFYELGVVNSFTQADVVVDEERTVHLVEAEGGQIDVVAVDDDGRGLPFATLEVKPDDGPGWIDLEGDVQRIDPFTDHHGRRTLRHVDVGDVAIQASWGSRRGELHVESIEGRRAEARIVVR